MKNIFTRFKNYCLRHLKLLWFVFVDESNDSWDEFKKKR